MDYAISRYAQCATVSPGGIICCHGRFSNSKGLLWLAQVLTWS